MEQKGIQRESLHIDRINEGLGYVPGNLQVLSNKANMLKRISYQGRDENNKPKFKTVKNVSKNYDSSTDEYPF